MPATIDGLRTGEAARLIGVSEQTVRGLVRAGKLQAVSTPLGALIDEDATRQLAAVRQAAQREKGLAGRRGEVRPAGPRVGGSR
jgi:excisionase family DNA binding protein